MAGPTDNETWLITAGDAVIKKMVDTGLAGLAPLERLVYCLWVADYGMRNAGDLDAADAIYPRFQSDARCIAEHLSLQATWAAFSLPRNTLESEYERRFELICDEIKNAEAGMSRSDSRRDRPQMKPS